MKRLTTLSITLISLVFTSGLATAQRGGGRPGSPAGPPPMADRGQMQNRSPRESREPRSVDHGRQTRPKMTASRHLENNTHLAGQLQKLFPPETDLKVASNDFKNLGQFVAAAHVSKNLGIPFDQLKSRMTGDSSVSLGKAIKELRPEVDATGEVRKAERQAKEDIKQSEADEKTKVKESKK